MGCIRILVHICAIDIGRFRSAHDIYTLVISLVVKSPDRKFDRQVEYILMTPLGIENGMRNMLLTVLGSDRLSDCGPRHGLGMVDFMKG
jgi:hypothetical protein